MKQIIIIIGTVILGCLLFNMMAAADPGSLKNVSLKVLERTMEEYG